MLSVTLGNGRYVAVGSYSGDDKGMIQTSDDGVNWITRSLQDYSTLQLFDVTYGNGTFVAVGWDGLYGNNLYHSTNGINWTSHNTKIANLFGVTYGGSVFVAVGDGSLVSFEGGNTNRQIYTSPDGISWTPRSSGSPANDVRGIFDVVYGGGRFVAVGSGYVYRSTTGATWSRSTNAAIGARIASCNGLFFAPSGPGTNLVSADGMSWTALTNTTGQTFRQLAYDSQLYLALTGSHLFSSPDGTNWTQRGLQISSNQFLTSFAYGATNLTIVGGAANPGPFYTTYSPAAYVSSPFLTLESLPTFPPQLKISGLVGRTYRIDYLTNLTSSSWQALSTFPLSNSPQIWTDTQATNVSRFYRTALLP